MARKMSDLLKARIHIEDPSVSGAGREGQGVAHEPSAGKVTATVHRRIASGVCLGVGVALLMTGCQTLTPAASSVPKDSQVRVTMNEWTIKPNIASIPAGKVTFEAVNQGAVLHEMVLLKTDLAPNGLKMMANEDKMDESAAGTNVGEITNLASGATVTKTFDLAAGHYLLVCNEIGHYHQGMVTAFGVK